MKESCSPFVRKAGISWPFYFECLGLPRRRKGRFCVNEKFKLTDLKKLKKRQKIKPVVPDITISPEDIVVENEVTEDYYEPKVNYFHLQSLTPLPPKSLIGPLERVHNNVLHR